MMMNIYDPMEVIVTPAITYILISHVNDSYRRIYTDGRDWPAEVEPICRLLDRQMDRRGRRRPLRRARGRDPSFESSAHLRRDRHPVPQGQSGRRQGADLSRQVRH